MLSAIGGLEYSLLITFSLNGLYEFPTLLESVVSFLEVLDDCDRAEKQLQSSDDVSVQKEGIQLVFNKLRSTMLANGVKAMESIHEEFDVEKHEAITEIPAPSEHLKGKVIDDVVKGYYLNDKIIRFAKVVVGK